MGNGFANRFLFVCAQRSKLLPEGGSPDPVVLKQLAGRLREALEHARRQAEMQRDEEAKSVWATAYGVLTGGKPGLLGSITSRAGAQVVRLSLLFALLDSSPVIRAEHLTAGLAVWKYCEASAQCAFGSKLGDPTADTVLASLRSSTGLSRTDISNLLGRHQSKSEISRALGVLVQCGLARSEQIGTEGKSVEIWSVLAK